MAQAGYRHLVFHTSNIVEMQRYATLAQSRWNQRRRRCEKPTVNGQSNHVPREHIQRNIAGRGGCRLRLIQVQVIRAGMKYECGKVVS